ncbi:MAG TPA: hypothetical protein VM240_08970 [Verrucomicrobiae bacterium]|nr:hypothetical protein [Verrucomicrobiae bacterium]
MNRMWLLLPAALAACGSRAPVVPVTEMAALEALARDRCQVALDADFDDSGRADFQRYVNWLTATQAGGTHLDPGEVTLAIARGKPKPGPKGVIAGEVSCGAGEEPFRITLYRDALVGRQLQTAFRTAAHEFHHIVQIRRDGLPCDAVSAERERYEKEAEGVADRLVPACARSAETSALR